MCCFVCTLQFVSVLAAVSFCIIYFISSAKIQKNPCMPKKSCTFASCNYKSNVMYYIIATVAIIAIELLYFVIAKRFHIVDRPNERSSHHRAVLLGAGIIFYLALLFYSLTNAIPYPNFLIGLSALAIISYIDDLDTFCPALRRFCQLLDRRQHHRDLADSLVGRRLLRHPQHL